MKRVLLLACLLLAQIAGAAEYTVMTCNIRITGLEADAPYPERVWENRRDLCIKTIKDQNPDFFCLQEVIYDSYEYFVKKFGKGWGHYGFEGPEMDPYTEGYHFIGKNVIFWNARKFEFVTAGCYWLSDTPQIGGSESWGTARARHCNWVRLRDKRTGKEFRLLDVHLDHISDEARAAQIAMVMEECTQYADDFPQILCGDFNAGISSVPIRYIRTCEKGWSECWEDMNGQVEAGYTAHGFKGVDRKGRSNRRIDFIWHRGPIRTLSCEILKNHVGNMYPSDHYFVVAKVEMK